MLQHGLEAVYAPSRQVRTVLVADLVESVRMIEADEGGTIARWRSFVDHVEHEILPRHGGRMVKSLGDGMMLEFAHAHPAVAAAFAIRQACRAANEGIPADKQMHLRQGAHVSPLYIGPNDIYGHGVNLAARLTTLAGPDEIVVSAEVRDELTADLDADVEDLGECYLKHISAPQRAYRVGPPGHRPVIRGGDVALVDLMPAIAVVPFRSRTPTPDEYVFGEVLADEVISALSQTAQLRVISRLSTTAFRDRDAPLERIAQHLNANYVLTGDYIVLGGRARVTAELVDAASQRVLWSSALSGDVRAILMGDDDLLDRIVTEVSGSILKREIERARTLALPTLASYTLLMGAIVLMHRGAPRDFERAGQMLEALCERAPRKAVPYAWLAKWHVLRFNRGRTRDKVAEAKVALDCTRRALDNEPNCALALTIDGFVHTNLLKRLDIGENRYALALEVNPNESLAWLLKGTLHAFRGEGEAAVEGTERALQLSPLDPLRYFYESLAATAAHSAGQYDRAVELARRALRENRIHPSTFRALAIALSQLGRMDEARQTVAELLKLQPDLTVRSYLESNPSGSFETGRTWAEALRRAGVPE